MRSPALLIPLLALLNACGSAPQPPTVDESLKRPANTAMAVELQVCKSELHNSRIVANESDRLAEATAAKMERAAAWQQALASVQAAAQAAADAPGAPGAPASGSPTDVRGNTIFSIGFAPGNARVTVPSDIEPALLDSAQSAPLVVLRVQTSGKANSAASSRITRERIAAVRRYLLNAGVDERRIRANYQWPGERTADKSVAAGTGLSQAVEVEVYRAMPIAIPVAKGMSSTSTP
jgi:hypothetical protein